MIWIVTDTAQEIQNDPANGIAVMQLPLMINQQECRDTASLSKEEFYQMLEDDNTTLTTSQATPAMFEALFSKLTESGDEVVCITLSSTLSGTYNSARLASLEMEGVYLVDSMNACLGQSALVKRAIQLREENHSAKEIAGILDQEKQDVVLLAAVDTLKYLKKGGRLSPAAAAVGNLLGIRPIVTVNQEGEVAVAGKTRGTKKCNRLLADLVQEQQPDVSRPMVFGYSGLEQDNLDLLKEQLEAAGIPHSDEALPLSPVLAVHAGPGAAGLAFFAKKRS